MEIGPVLAIRPLSELKSESPGRELPRVFQAEFESAAQDENASDQRRKPRSNSPLPESEELADMKEAAEDFAEAPAAITGGKVDLFA